MPATRPVLGYVNYARRSTTVLASADVASGSSIANLVDPNLTAVANFGVGAAKAFTGAFASALQPRMLYIRFRGAIPDITATGIRLRLSPNSDLSSPAKDTPFAPQFPSPWPDEMPVRPIFVAVWDPVTACPYFGIDIARTAGESDLEIAYFYLGEALELTGAAGYRVYGSSVGVEDHSEDALSALQSDAEVPGAARRFAKIKVTSKTSDHIDAEWYPKLLYAAPRSVVYWAKPTSTDSLVIQSQVLMGSVSRGQSLDIQHEHFNSHEQEFVLRERL